MDRFTLHSLIRSDSENEDDQSDIDSKDDSESLELEEGDSLAPCRIPLGLTVNYCQDWTTRDAFREFYQNWFVFDMITLLYAALVILVRVCN